MSQRRTALVTGGTGAIGAAIVTSLAKWGMRVLLGCRDIRRGSAVADAIVGDVVPLEFDLTDREETRRSLVGGSPKRGPSTSSSTTPGCCRPGAPLRWPTPPSTRRWRST